MASNVADTGPIEDDNVRSESSRQKKKYELIKDPIHGSIELHPLLADILKTPPFHRLKYIHQLNGLYYVYPGARHTRYDHSIGVCYLAGEFARMLIKKLREEQEIKSNDVEEVKKRDAIRKKDEANILCVQIAGLCHNLGHGPFSHLFDEILKTHGKKHQKIACMILRKMIYPEREQWFEDEGIQLKKIEQMIDRSENDIPPDEHYLFEIVANKETGIDVNKFDYFIRDCHYLGLQHEFDYRRLMQLSRVIKIGDKYKICFSDKDANNILGLFRTRCSLHVRAYQHRDGVAVTHILRAAIEKILDVPLINGDNGEWISINNILENLSENTVIQYIHLNDTVILSIIQNTDENTVEDVHRKSLREAKKLIKKLEGESMMRRDELCTQTLPHRLPLQEITKQCESNLGADLKDKSRKDLLSDLSGEIDSDKLPKGEEILDNLYDERFSQHLLLEKCLEAYLSEKPVEDLQLMLCAARQRDDIGLKAFFEKDIPPELLLEKCIFEVMERQKNKLCEEINTNLCTRGSEQINSDESSLEEIIFAEKVKLSYGSESEQTNPMYNVLFYRDSKSRERYEILEKGKCYAENESLRLFTPVKFIVEEYWWYSERDETDKEDKKVIKAIAEVLTKKIKLLLNNKFVSRQNNDMPVEQAIAD